MLTRKIELTHEEIVVLYYNFIDSGIRFADYGIDSAGYEAAIGELRKKIKTLIGKGKTPKPKTEDIWKAVLGSVGRGGS